MSETSAADSLSRRLTIGRLSGPGVLYQRALQRTHDRLAPPSRRQALDRLHRRIAPETPTTERLPLVRVDRFIDRSAAASIDARSGASASAAGAGGTPGQFVGGLVARQTPTISRSREFVARRIASTPSLLAASDTMSGVLWNANHSGNAPRSQSTMVGADASKDIVRRVPDRAAGRDPRATALGSPAPQSSDATVTPTVMAGALPSHRTPAGSPTGARDGLVTPTEQPRVAVRATEPVVWRKVDASVQPSTASSAILPSLSAASPTGGVSPLIATASGVPSTSLAAAGIVPSAGVLPRVSVGNRGTAFPPVLWQKSNTTAPIAAAAGLANTTASPSISAAPTQLVLRKAVVSGQANQGPTQSPSITPSPPQIIARMAADEGHRTAYGPSTSSHDWNIDWITEQVGRRLARRLEIERERMGTRSWR
jgi:hypothetical protein